MDSCEGIIIYCQDPKKAEALQKEAGDFVRYHGVIDAVGVSRRPCPECESEIHVFFLSQDSAPVADFVSLEERYEREADEFFARQRIENPHILSCSGCGATGNNWKKLRGKK